MSVYIDYEYLYSILYLVYSLALGRQSISLISKFLERYAYSLQGQQQTHHIFVFKLLRIYVGQIPLQQKSQYIIIKKIVIAKNMFL